MSKTRRSGSKIVPAQKQFYENVGTLLQENLDQLDKEDTRLREEFENIEEKLVGGTVGYIVREKSEKEEGKEKYLLLKKSGRTQVDIKGQTTKTVNLKKKSSDQMNLVEGIRESFNEKGASVLFDIFKQREDYLPQFYLVTSEFSPKKIHNKLKVGTGAKKVYIASEILGDYRVINDEAKFSDNARIIGDRSKHPQLAQLTNDLCENAVIMILLSNYDIKVDNFVYRESDAAMVPVDFGCARREGDSCDVLSGIDMIRRNDKVKELSSTYSSRKMQETFSIGDGYINTQSFYSKRLAPQHFLDVIDKIKSDPDIEEKLRDAAYKWTFGSAEEKQKYSDIIVARTINLLKLEPVLRMMQTNASNRDFSSLNLRDEVAESAEYDLELRTSNSSKGKEFFRSVDRFFNDIIYREEEIITLLELYGDADNEEEEENLQHIIESRVKDFNQSLFSKSENFEELFVDLAEYYKDSEYLSNDRKGRGSWVEYRCNIQRNIDQTIAILTAPLLDNESESLDSDDGFEDLIPEYGVVTVENLGGSKDGESKEVSPSDNNSDRENDDVEADDHDVNEQNVFPLPPSLSREVSEQNSNWDLQHWEKYRDKMRDIREFTVRNYTGVLPETKLLLTHLSACDTLNNVRNHNLTITEQIASMHIIQEIPSSSPKNTDQNLASLAAKDSQSFNSK